MGRWRDCALHGVRWPDQLDLRYRDLPRHVERVQCEHCRKAIAVSIGLVCRRLADPDDHRAHDSDPAYSLHPKQGRYASNSADGLHHGFRHLSTILVGGLTFGLGAVALVLFSLARGNLAELLRAHAIDEADLHSSLRPVAITAGERRVRFTLSWNAINSLGR